MTWTPLAASATTDTTNASNISSGTLAIAQGGTNSGTANGALNNLLPSQTGNANKVLQTDGANTSWIATATGTVTSVSSANTDIGVSMASPTPVLTLNTGTGNNQIVKLDGTAKLPAVDGSALTNLNASALTTGAVDVGRGGTGNTSFANYSVIASNGAGNQVAVPGSTSNTMLQWTVTGPAWSSATFPSSTTVNQLLYSSASNIVGGLSTANNSVLTTDASGVPSFVANLPGTKGGTGQSVYVIGDLLYASSTSALSRLAASSTGFVLTSGGPGAAPTWAAPATSGTVTSASVVSANGFSGSVANATSTPAITISTSVTGLLKGDGTGVSAAVAGDFPILNQNTTGTAANITGTVAVANGGTGTATAGNNFLHNSSKNMT